MTIHKDIRKYYWPVTKSYLHRLSFYVIYCAFLIIPATGRFLGQFRAGGAFMAIFLSIGMIAPWVRYYQSLKAFEQGWPTEKDKEDLYQDFSESVSVFGGEARIGKKYTFLRQEESIVPTKEIKEFRLLRARSGVIIKVSLQSSEITITKLAIHKDIVEELQTMVTEAQSCLMEMQGQQ